MVSSNRALLLLLPAFFIGLSAFSSFDDHVRVVTKNDGTWTNYRFLPVHFDPAQREVVEARMMSEEFRDLPAQYHIPTSELPAVRDQGARGTCAYFATVGLLESYYIHRDPKANQSLELSEECLVDVRNWEFDQGANYIGEDKPAQRPDPDGDLPNSIVLTVAARGVPKAAQYPLAKCEYVRAGGGDVNLPAYLSTMSGDPGTSATYGKDLSFDLNTKPTIDTIRALIARNIPVEVGILVYNEYFSTPNWRFNSFNDTDDTLAGGHAVQLVGYSTEGDSTIFTFKNSWGSAWGDEGYGTMDDKLLLNAWGYDPSYDFITSIK